ncbi:hypothetical protein CTheo_7104 [Ceratobasidium theobromae]|uniref:Transmembrane protein n=1 Tax=Ceratobasidium theobromae TaxID=1582974 RepID=A0A5N5QCF1_9AGAM|nr:hypothetical protein CTheo_7104 [Ceratobasidium theobromae]
MPLHNVTIDDSSALIEYHAPIGDWTDSPTTDDGLSNYYDHTYHSSNQYGASAFFRFQGTAVYLYAAKRSRHGQYNIFIDNKFVVKSNGYSETNRFLQDMFHATNLSPGWHNLTCVNADRSNKTYTEVDSILWTTNMAGYLTEISGKPIPYNSDSMKYSSSNAWSEYNGDSNPTTVTSTLGASVNITFNGNGIELYGKTGPSFGPFSAQVDGYDLNILNASSAQAHSTLIFRQDTLPPGNHTLVVINRSLLSLAISSAVPVTWSSDPNNPNPTPTSTQSNPGRPHISSGIIAGGVVAGVIVLAGFVLLLLWMLRRRRRARRERDIAVRSIAEPTYFDVTPFAMPLSSPTQSSQPYSPISTRGSKPRGEGSSPGATLSAQYHSVPGSPGMSSRGSFENPSGSGGFGASGSGSGGSNSGWPAPPAAAWGAIRPTGPRRPSGQALRIEASDNADMLRDR